MRPHLGAGIVVAALLVACDDATDPDPSLTEVQWTLSAGTCVGSSSIVFLVDGIAVGVERLSAGESSRIYDVIPGSRFLSAREDVFGGRVWDEPLPVEFLPGHRIVRVLDCL